MFTTLIVQPLFNLLVLIYAILPGHNFGLALIVFTVVVRLAMWPLVKKQLHQAKAMRKLQPELKKIKKSAKGNRQKESLMMMELYKERGISPFGTLPTLIVQLVIMIGLFLGLKKIIDDPKVIETFSYGFIQDMSWIKHLGENIHFFDNTLLGWADLSKAALPNGGGLYWPAFLLVLGSGAIQYFLGKQLLPDAKDSKSLKTILKEAGEGKQADQTDVNAAVGRTTMYFLPVMIVVFTLGLPSGLALYWLVGGLVAFAQQAYILREDEEELEELAEAPAVNINDATTTKKDPKRRRQGSKVAARNAAAIPEAEIVSKTKKATSSTKASAGKKSSTTTKKTSSKTNSKTAGNSKKRR